MHPVIPDTQRDRYLDSSFFKENTGFIFIFRPRRDDVPKELHLRVKMLLVVYHLHVNK